MLKRNLIIVVVISLSVFLTSNAFGQNTKRKTAKKAKVATPTTSTPPTNARTANPNPNQPGFTATDDLWMVKETATPTSSTPTNNAGTTAPLDSDQSGMIISTGDHGIKSPTNPTSGLPTGNKSAREAGSGNATGLVNAPLTPVNVTTPKPKARKSTKRKKP